MPGKKEEQAIRISGYENLDESKICYWMTDHGWLINLPGCGIGGLAKHSVVEHEDGTITVTPSILTTGYASGHEVTRHGFLTKGIWREC